MIRLCRKLPTCHGMHEEAIHDEAERRRIAFCAVTPEGDHLDGAAVVLVVTTMLGFVVRADGVRRCRKCDVVGPDCVSYSTVSEDGVRTNHRCSID